MREDFRFLSKDGKTWIHAVRWTPDKGEIRAVVQLTHGMVEHIGRYERFAQYLNTKGLLVVGHDHLGHGKSITSKTEYGTAICNIR